MITANYLARYESDALRGIDDVKHALQAVNDVLEDSTLDMLRNFNKAYLIITQNVQRHLKQGDFTDPQFLERFDVQFVRYYFRALEGYLRGDDIPAAWRATFERCQRAHGSPLKAMALGVNAHVNNDIAQVLRDCGATDKHRGDYNLVNDIIRDSIYETIDNLQSYRSLLNPKHSPLKPVYKFVMNILIRVWRGTAWRKYMRIREEHYSIAKLERRADLLSRGTRRLPI